MQVYEQVTPLEAKTELAAQSTPPPRVDKSYWWTLLQAVLCALVLLLALLAKQFFPSAYEEARRVYDSEMSRSIVITDADGSAS